MKKGVVVNYNDDFVTVLTPDGQFIKTNNGQGDYVIGNEISFFPLADEREEAATRLSQLTKVRKLTFLNSKKTRVGALSLIAIMFFMISFLPFFNNDKVYAYMSIDINPSFEVGIDDHLNVISLEPLNEEAEKIRVNLLDWRNKPFDEIIDAIVVQSKANGYVYPGKEIVITTVINDKDHKIQPELEENINNIQTSYENEQMIVQTIKTDRETREMANKQGISMGKYVKLKEKEKLKEKKVDDKNDEPIKDETPKPQTEKKSENSNQQETPDAVIKNSQSAKNKLTSDTKIKLNEAKNKAREMKKEVKEQSKKKSPIDNTTSKTNKNNNHNEKRTHNKKSNNETQGKAHLKHKNQDGKKDK